MARSSKLLFSLYFPTLLSTLHLLPSVSGELRNITVDDSDASIQYTGGFTVSKNNLDNNGSLHWTTDSAASIQFNFTGVAFYYLSPTFPYKVEALISIADTHGSSGTLFDNMTDRSAPFQALQPGSETGKSGVMFWKDGLANEEHTVSIDTGSEQSALAFDGYIYTVDDSSPPSGSNGSSNGNNDNKGGNNNGNDNTNNAINLKMHTIEITALSSLLCMFGAVFAMF